MSTHTPGPTTKDRLANGMKKLAEAVDAMENLAPDDGTSATAALAFIRQEAIKLYDKARANWGVLP